MVDLPGAHVSRALVVTVLETNNSGVEQEIMRKDDGSECIVIWYAILIWLIRKLSSSPGSVDADCLRDDSGASLPHSARSLRCPFERLTVAMNISWQ